MHSDGLEKLIVSPLLPGKFPQILPPTDSCLVFGKQHQLCTIMACYMAAACSHQGCIPHGRTPGCAAVNAWYGGCSPMCWNDFGSCAGNHSSLQQSPAPRQASLQTVPLMLSLAAAYLRAARHRQPGQLQTSFKVRLFPRLLRQFLQLLRSSQNKVRPALQVLSLFMICMGRLSAVLVPSLKVSCMKYSKGVYYRFLAMPANFAANGLDKPAAMSTCLVLHSLGDTRQLPTNISSITVCFKCPKKKTNNDSALTLL